MPNLSLPVRSMGDGLGIVLPQKVVRELGLREGTIVDVKIRKVKASGFGIARGAPPWDRKRDRDDMREY